MCRLFGQISTTEQSIDYWMLKAPRPLVGWSEEHGHGWGIGWYDRGCAHLEKAPGPAQKSEKFAALAGSVRSSLYVCHLRKATCGEQTSCNSQPFLHDNWLYGHNGTVDRDWMLSNIDSTNANLQGDTDSEVYLLWLQQKLIGGGIAGLTRALEIVRQRPFTALNFVLSDSKSLYGYWEKSPSAHTNDRDYYQLYYLETIEPEKSVVICSEKLDDRDWKRIPHGSLIVIDQRLTPEIHQIIK